jgi:hypothetical protein
MKRFLTILAATAVAAAVTIPALADNGSPGDELDTFGTCLKAHGIPIPADLTGIAIKEWVGAHQDTPGLEAAFKACDPHPGDVEKADHAAPEELVACLRANGLEPPSNVADLKPWILQQDGTSAGRAALHACDFSTEHTEKAAVEGGPCGSEKAKAARVGKAKASRAGKPKAQTTPGT